jgi:hypothetical protein
MADAHQEYVFRRLVAGELDAGYACLLDTCAWLEQKRIRQWLKPLPKETYARRHARGENFGLFENQRLLAIVSLMHAIPDYWHDLVPNPSGTWLACLAVRTPGEGIGARTVQAALDLLTQGKRLPVYLDCRTGFLERFYCDLGFQSLALRSFQPAPDFAYEAALMCYGDDHVCSRSLA